jgi:hypothetical protein
VENQEDQERGSTKGRLNYYLVATILILLLAYSVCNSVQPFDNTKMSFFDYTYLISFGVVAVFGFVTARRFRGSKVFEKAYLSLSLGYACYFIGSLVWFIFAVFYKVQNPYPYYPDIAYFAFFPFIIYHLRTNIHYFKPKLDKRQKLMLFSIPVGITSVFIFVTLVPMDVTGGVANLKIQPMPAHDQTFWITNITSTAYVILDTLILASALVGAQVFRNSILGSAWGLLLAALTMYTIADLLYYHFEAFGVDVGDQMYGLWVGNCMIACYALYKHTSIRV